MQTEAEIRFPGQRHRRGRIEPYCQQCGKVETHTVTPSGAEVDVELHTMKDHTILCDECKWSHGHKHGHGPASNANLNFQAILDWMQAQ
jgi:hypothetical protein